MAGGPSARKGIKDVFYETRVLTGRDYTLRRFASEVLGNSVDPVMLGYIEKGKRFPSEALVRRLAAMRKQDPHELLALLWRDRMLYAFGKELKRVLHAPRARRRRRGRRARGAGQPGDRRPTGRCELDPGRHAGARRSARCRGARTVDAKVAEPLAKQVEQTLVERELVEVRGGKVRRRGRHFVPQNTEERQRAGARVLRAVRQGPARQAGAARCRHRHLSAQPLPQHRPGAAARVPRRLEAAVRALAEEFADDPSRDSRFLNILITATPF